MSEDLPNPMTDLENEDFINMPSAVVDADEKIILLETEDFIEYTYTRCDNCIFAQHGCKVYQEHGNCQIERNLFREHLKEIMAQGGNPKDKMLIMLGFIQLKGAWRSASKLAIFDERSEFQGVKEAVQLLKSNHKTISDYTKEYLRVQKELLATPKERRSKTVAKSNEDSFSIHLAKIREEIENEDD